MKARYVIVENGRAIKCLTCEMTSWSAGDVKHRYCAKCLVFHEDEEVKHRLIRMMDRIDLKQIIIDTITDPEPGR
jgi:hypothetical protein